MPRLRPTGRSIGSLALSSLRTRGRSRMPGGDTCTMRRLGSFELTPMAPLLHQCGRHERMSTLCCDQVVRRDGESGPRSTTGLMCEKLYTQVDVARSTMAASRSPRSTLRGAMARVCPSRTESSSSEACGVEPGSSTIPLKLNRRARAPIGACPSRRPVARSWGVCLLRPGNLD